MTQKILSRVLVQEQLTRFLNQELGEVFLLLWQLYLVEGDREGEGRFISEDLIRDGQNWYVYVGNNPLVFVDPSGLQGVGLSENPLFLNYENRFGYSQMTTFGIFNDMNNSFMTPGSWLGQGGSDHGLTHGLYGRFMHNGDTYSWNQHFYTPQGNKVAGSNIYDTDGNAFFGPVSFTSDSLIRAGHIFNTATQGMGWDARRFSERLQNGVHDAINARHFNWKGPSGGLVHFGISAGMSFGNENFDVAGTVGLTFSPGQQFTLNAGMSIATGGEMEGMTGSAMAFVNAEVGFMRAFARSTDQMDFGARFRAGGVAEAGHLDIFDLGFGPSSIGITAAWDWNTINPDLSNSQFGYLARGFLGDVLSVAAPVGISYLTLIGENHDD